MTSCRRLLFLSSALLLGSAATLPASAFLRAAPVDTVEWITFDADVVVRGVATRIVPGETGATRSVVVTVRVTETLKGPPAESVTFLAATDATAEWGKGEHLYFLVQSPKLLAAYAGSSMTTDLAARLVSVPLAMRPHWQSRPVPMSGGAPAPYRLFDAHGRPMQTPQAILALIRREAAEPPKNPQGVIELHLSPRSPFFPSSLDAPYLNLLVDERAEARAKEWVRSPEPLDRWNGVQVLSKFRSAQNAARLRSMLEDPFDAEGNWPGGSDFVWDGGDGKWRESVYPMRTAAYQALKAWGDAPAEAVLGKPAHPARYLKRWVPAAWLAGLAAAVAVVLLWGWVGPGRWTGGLTGASLLLLGVVGGLWIRSRGTIDEVALPAADGRRWEVASLNGTVRAMRMDHWPAPAPAAWTRAARNPATEADWRPKGGVFGRPTGSGPTRVSWLGFAVETGTIRGPAYTPYAYRAWTVPLWAVCAVLAIAPGARAVYALTRRRRASANCCRACGYDLRATPDRCPECGVAAGGGAARRDVAAKAVGA